MLLKLHERNVHLPPRNPLGHFARSERSMNELVKWPGGILM